MQSGGGDLYIGRRETAIRYLKGYVDEIRLKNNAESPGNLHSTTSSSPYSWDGNTAAIFHFDEGSGNYVTSNEAGHRATLGTSTTGDAAEPTWRAYHYLSQGLPLPVELSSFTAFYEDRAVILNWTTETEAGGVGFIINRRTEEKEIWEPIASYVSNKNLVCMDNPIGAVEYTFVDSSIEPGTTYFYRLSVEDIYGNVKALDVIKITLVKLPEKTELVSAYPNPFNPQTKIRYNLAEDGVVDLSVYNVLGKKLRQLIPGLQRSAGSYHLDWDGKNNSGEFVSSGTYIIYFHVDKIIQTKKMVLVR